MEWYIHETACYPAKFKVNQHPTDQYAGDNCPSRFFCTRDEAWEYIKKQKKLEAANNTH